MRGGHRVGPFFPCTVLQVNSILFTAALAAGFLVLTVYVATSPAGLPRAWPGSPLAWLALLWLGPLGTTFTYVYWTVALTRASVAAVSLTAMQLVY